MYIRGAAGRPVAAGGAWGALGGARGRPGGRPGSAGRRPGAARGPEGASGTNVDEISAGPVRKRGFTDNFSAKSDGRVAKSEGLRRKGFFLARSSKNPKISN